MAVAASMLVTVGSIGLALARSSQSLPSKLELAAVKRHDGCCNSPQHHGDKVPQDSFPRIGQYLRQELDHPVLAADLKNEGWQLEGAAICPVDGVRGAHLLYRRHGYQTLSIFSLPASSFPSLANHQTYEGTIDGHSVIARCEDGAVFCMVGHCPEGAITVADLGRMLNDHEPEASVATTPGPRISVAGITREP